MLTQQEKKEFDEKFPEGTIGHKHNENCEWTCELRPKLKKHLSQMKEKWQREEREKLERIKMELDVVECDCGEPYRDSDVADLVNDFLDQLNNKE